MRIVINNLGDLLKYLKDIGKLITVKDVLNRYYEVTKTIRKAEEVSSCIMYKVKGSDITCLSNVVYSREALYRYLNVSSDEEFYKLVNKVISLPPKNLYTLINEGYLNILQFSNFYEIRKMTLNDLPAIKFFERDGGAYFTSSIVISEIPSKRGHYNASIHRLMLLDDHRLAIRLVPRHLYSIYKENMEEGRETPVAIVFSADPITLFLSATSPPYGTFELSGYYIITNNSLPTVLTPKYKIPVPAYASVVLEGRITGKLTDEGPFTDLLGLYDRVRKQPVLEVDHIYVSKYDIPFHIILPSGIEHMILMGLPREAAIWNVVSKAVPKVVKVRLTKGGGGWLHAVVSIKKVSEGDAKTAILAAFAAHPSLKHVVVVDDDIDPDDPTEVEWAIATRFQADKDLILITNARGSSLDPSARDGLTSKVGIDATAPLSSKELYMRAKVGDGG